jgi:hypothetical protein
MPEGEGYLFDALDAALQSGPSEERALARHFEIGVAGPILTSSRRFSENGFAAFLTATPNCRNQTPSGGFDFGRSER